MQFSTEASAVLLKDTPFAPLENQDTYDYFNMILSKFTLDDFAKKLVIMIEQEMVKYLEILGEISDLRDRAHDLSSLFDDREECEFLQEKRKLERNIRSAFEFDQLVSAGSMNANDYIWALSFFDSVKEPAYNSINELRGIVMEVGQGLFCSNCKKNAMTISPIQTNSGDEPTKMKTVCTNCKKVAIIG